MSTIEDDLPSPELGHPTTPTRAPHPSTEPSKSKDQVEEEEEDEEDEEDEEEEEPAPKKKRTLKRDTHEWTLLPRLEKGDGSGFDDEEINHQVYQEAKKTMEQSGLHKLATHKPQESDLYL